MKSSLPFGDGLCSVFVLDSRRGKIADVRENDGISSSSLIFLVRPLLLRMKARGASLIPPFVEDEYHVLLILFFVEDEWHVLSPSPPGESMRHP